MSPEDEVFQLLMQYERKRSSPGGASIVVKLGSEESRV
jgi:hypothetical protein